MTSYSSARKDAEDGAHLFQGRLTEAIWKRNRAGTMDFYGSCYFYNPLDVMTVDTAAGKDSDGVGMERRGLLNQLAEYRDASFGCRGSTRSEDTSHAQLTETAQGRGLVGYQIKGTVEGKGQTCGGAHQKGGNRLVNSVLWC